MRLLTRTITPLDPASSQVFILFFCDQQNKSIMVRRQVPCFLLSFCVLDDMISIFCYSTFMFLLFSLSGFRRLGSERAKPYGVLAFSSPSTHGITMIPSVLCTYWSDNACHSKVSPFRSARLFNKLITSREQDCSCGRKCCPISRFKISPFNRRQKLDYEARRFLV